MRKGLGRISSQAHCFLPKEEPWLLIIYQYGLYIKIYTNCYNVSAVGEWITFLHAFLFVGTAILLGIRVRPAGSVPKVQTKEPPCDTPQGGSFQTKNIS